MGTSEFTADALFYLRIHYLVPVYLPSSHLVYTDAVQYHLAMCHPRNPDIWCKTCSESS